MKILPVIFLLISQISLAQPGWNRLFPDTAQYITAIYFTNSTTGYIGTCTGTIQKTTDGGLSWLSQNSGSGQWIQSVYFINSDTGYYTGSHGTIFKTTNGGISWLQAANLNTELFSIWFINSNTGYAAGHSAVIYKTTNGALNWVSQYFNSDEVLFSICMINSNTGFTAGTNGKILKTINGGTNWVLQYSGVINLLRSVYFTDVNTGYITADNAILKTTNSGVNWQKITLIDKHLNDISFINPNTGYAAGSNGIILKTYNGGINWSVQESGTNSNLTNIFFTNKDTGFSVGGEYNFFGIVLKTVHGGEPIGIIQISKEIPDKFLLYQNFPNPFNPSTIIRFDNPKSDRVKLSIFDALGREISTLVNESLSAGTYEVEWDASRYPSGIYYYKLTSGKRSATSKMVLLK